MRLLHLANGRGSLIGKWDGLGDGDLLGGWGKMMSDMKLEEEFDGGRDLMRGGKMISFSIDDDGVNIKDKRRKLHKNEVKEVILRKYRKKN